MATTKKPKLPTGTSTKTDSLDAAALKADLGDSYGVGLILANPELLAIAYQSQGWTNAKVVHGVVVPGKKTEGEEWTADKIQLEITNSKWYQHHDGSQRVAENARLSDPGTWQRNLNDVADTLTKQAATMGADLTGVDVNKLASQILEGNYLYIDRSPDGKIPDSVITGFLVPHIKKRGDGSFGGAAGTNAAVLRQMADSYGVQMTDKWYLDAVQGLQSGTLTEQDLKSQIVNNSRSAWQGIGDRISDTVSVKDLASSYIQTLANTLEIDPDSINLNTPEIKKAMSYVDPSGGQVRQKTLWEFEQDLRHDPRWDNTKQGQKELSDAGMKMLKDFGFIK